MIRFVRESKPYLINFCYMIEQELNLNSTSSRNEKAMQALLGGKSRFKLFLQTGAWDMYYSNVLYPTLSSMGIQALVEALQMISMRRCSWFLTIHILSTPPESDSMVQMLRPYLQEKFNPALQNIHVKEKYYDYLFRSTVHRGYRINSAIGAFIAYTKQQVEQIEYPSKLITDYYEQLHQQHKVVPAYVNMSRLVYSNAFDLMRLFTDEAADNVHFLRPVYGFRGVQPSSSLAGEILVSTVVQGVCELI
ncbi:hypothetical protein EON65_35145 [archaeon]|nr:MAG: hypothetical protein EON65_35145 [archaeon]